MIFSEECRFQYNDYNKDGELMLRAMLYQFEQAAADHSVAGGDTLDRQMEQGIAWILAGWRIHVERYPKYGEPITVNTWIALERNGSLIMNRCFSLTDADGNEVVLADGSMGIYDWGKQSTIKMSEELFALYEPEERHLWKRRLPRVRLPETLEREQPALLRRSDTDYNGHVHNTYYLNFAMEALSQEDYENNAIHDVAMVYHNPLKLGDSPFVRSSYSPESGTYSIGIFGSEEKPAFQAELKK